MISHHHHNHDISLLFQPYIQQLRTHTYSNVQEFHFMNIRTVTGHVCFAVESKNTQIIALVNG